jgi:hypothetical protein
MTFPMPVLVGVTAARSTATGLTDYQVTATNHQGNPEPEIFWYTRDPNETTLFGQPYTFGAEIDAWRTAHPDFPVEPYVAPPAPPEPTPAEKLVAAGLSVDDLKALLGL